MWPKPKELKVQKNPKKEVSMKKIGLLILLVTIVVMAIAITASPPPAKADGRQTKIENGYTHVNLVQAQFLIPVQSYPVLPTTAAVDTNIPIVQIKDQTNWSPPSNNNIDIAESPGIYDTTPVRSTCSPFTSGNT